MKISFVFTSLFLSCFFFLSAQPSTIYFEKDSYKLTSDAQKKLDSVVRFLNTQVAGEIALIGHTDHDASDHYNKKLSLQRAKSVNDYLTSKNINNRIHILSRGETELVNANRDEEEKSMNRRVEIIYGYRSNNSVYSAFYQEPQKFTLTPIKDTIITGQKGIQIQIDSGVFDLVDNRPVTVSLQEYTTKYDFITGNLTTLTKQDKIIESRGMINIKVEQNGQPVALKDGKTLGILFPDRKKDDNTEIFYGNEHNNEVTWQPSTQNPLGKNRGESFFVSEKENGEKDTITYFEWWEEEIDGELYTITKSLERPHSFSCFDPSQSTSTNYDSLKLVMDTISMKNKMLMNELMLSSENLGWINCDRFYDNDAPKTDIIVEYNVDFEPDVSLVFTEINSVLPYSHREDNKLIFNNIPINMKFKLVGLYKKDSKKEVLVAQKECISRMNGKEFISFENVAIQELEKKLDL